MISLELLKQLREETGVSISECKKALEQSNGSMEEAKNLLKKWGKDIAGKKSGREIKNGIIDSYIHPNKRVGILLELGCESDFVAMSHDFKNLAHELCLQIAAIDSDTPLLEQNWIKDESKSVKELIDECIMKVGENIAVRNSVKFKI